MLRKAVKQPKFSLARLRWQRPRLETLKKLTLAGLVALATVGAFCWGRFGGHNQARGQSPQAQIDASLYQTPGRGDRNGHVVAYIFGDIPITREELGEYLVQRCGADWLDFLVNRNALLAYGASHAGI